MVAEAGPKFTDEDRHPPGRAVGLEALLTEGTGMF